MSRQYKFGPYRLTRHILLRGDDDVRLTQKQIDILYSLVENRSRAISSSEILETFWPVQSAGDNEAKFVELNNVTQNISALRKGLGEKPPNYKYIRTVGSTYQFIAKTEVEEEINESGDAVDGTSETRQKLGETTTRAGAQEVLSELNDKQVRFGDQATAPTLASGGHQPTITIRGLWNTARGSLRLVILAGIGITVVASIITPLLDPSAAKMYVSLPQLFLLIGALGYVLPGPKDFRPIRKDIESANKLRSEVVRATGYDNVREWRDARHIAKGALARYTVYWRGILASWVLLYACLVFTISTTQTLLTIFCNNCNTALLVLSYNILNQSKAKDEDDHEVSDVSWIMVSIAFVIASLALEILVMRLRVPNDKREILLYGLSLTSGIAGGIAMALFVGRLQSKFLGPSPQLVLALYSYTAIQSLFIFLVDIPEGKLVFDKTTVMTIAVIMINIALVLKCLLFLYVAKLFQDGRLLFYFVRVRRAYREVEEEFRHFKTVLSFKN